MQVPPTRRLMDQRHLEAWHTSPHGAGRQARRHLVVAADGAFMDLQQAALDQAAAGDRTFEAQPADLGALWASAGDNPPSP